MLSVSSRNLSIEDVIFFLQIHFDCYAKLFEKVTGGKHMYLHFVQWLWLMEVMDDFTPEYTNWVELS